MKKFFNSFKNEMNAEHEGAVAFEYIIILVIMAVAIFFCFGILRDVIADKAADIANAISKNGAGGVPAGTGGYSNGGTRTGAAQW